MVVLLLIQDNENLVLQGKKEAEKMIVEAYAALLLAFLSTERFIFSLDLVLVSLLFFLCVSKAEVIFWNKQQQKYTQCYCKFTPWSQLESSCPCNGAICGMLAFFYYPWCCVHYRWSQRFIILWFLIIFDRFKKWLLKLSLMIWTTQNAHWWQFSVSSKWHTNLT